MVLPGSEKQAYSANNEKSGERHGEGAEAVGQCEEVHEETDERKEQEDSQVDEQHNEKSQVEEHDRQASEEQPNPQAQANNETTEKRLNTPNRTRKLYSRLPRVAELTTLWTIQKEMRIARSSVSHIAVSHA